MSKKANPTYVGLFIVVALALGIAGLIVFSSSTLFTSTQKCVLYFDSSLNGLTKGTPVKYRGVAIGSVKRVMLHFNQATNDFSMPVIIEIQDKDLRARLGQEVFFQDGASGGTTVNRDLRATLEAESLLTGVLYVDLDTTPDGETPHYHQLQPLYPEIPTKTQETQQLMKNLAHLDINGLVEKITALTTNLSGTFASLNAGEMSRQVTNLLTTLNRVVNMPELSNTIAALPGTVAQYRLLAIKLNSRVDPLADNITNTLAQATRTLVQLQGGAETLRMMLEPDSSLRSDLTQALEQLAAAAQSIALLADYLHNHPNAVLTGRKQPTQKP